MLAKIGPKGEPMAFLSQCPSNFKPRYYKRYVDDTFTIFDNNEQALNFLEYINKVHPNLKFTIDFENNKKLNFLDILVHNNNHEFKFSVFRKSTFTNLSINFFSFCPLIYKINALKTLIHRSYKICSDYDSLHSELQFLKELFLKNGFPLSLIYSITKKFLDQVFVKPKVIHTVPKKLIYISLPYFGPKSNILKTDLHKFLSDRYKSINFQIVLTNNFSINSFFNFKDQICSSLCSGIVYLFKCPHCNIGQYVGSTIRNLHIRIHEHMGVSHRTGRHLAKPPFSAIRNHCEGVHGVKPSPNDFSILKKVNDNKLDIHIIESLYIKIRKPDLNNMLSSYPLHLS